MSSGKGQLWRKLVVMSGTPVRRRLVVVRSESLRYVYYSPNSYCSSYSISFECRQFTPPFGEWLVALSLPLQDCSFGTILEPWVGVLRECEVVAAFEHLRDSRPIVSSVLLNAGAASVEFLGELVGK
ncbi:hypothetical protein F511_33029 [Dorcoceras hygrometricum]|uniref:Uncharacterized protein n=1 Tax=Dorcoceras hygrometricum TaxID=472368 RepID=A0A2Z7CC25_9LAMI|nr:hypothetical protein F511_33029 [Dorcoceras hygrometricum]